MSKKTSCIFRECYKKQKESSSNNNKNKKSAKESRGKPHRASKELESEILIIFTHASHRVEHHRQPTPLPLSTPLLLGHLTVGYHYPITVPCRGKRRFFSVERLNKKCFLTSLGDAGKDRRGRGGGSQFGVQEMLQQKDFSSSFMRLSARTATTRCGKLLPPHPLPGQLPPAASFAFFVVLCWHCECVCECVWRA